MYDLACYLAEHNLCLDADFSEGEPIFVLRSNDIEDFYCAFNIRDDRDRCAQDIIRIYFEPAVQALERIKQD